MGCVSLYLRRLSGEGQAIALLYEIYQIVKGQKSKTIEFQICGYRQSCQFTEIYPTGNPDGSKSCGTGR